MRRKFKKTIRFYEDEQERVLISLGDMPSLLDYARETTDIDEEMLVWLESEIAGSMMVALKAEKELDELVLIKMTAHGLILCQDEEVQDFLDGLSKKEKEDFIWV